MNGKADLLRALGHVVRGLSALFWGLPVAVIVYVNTVGTNWFDGLGQMAVLPAVVLSAVMWHGLNQLRFFQQQERVWQRALNRAEIFAIVNTGLSPFLHWWRVMPFVPLFTTCAALLFLCGLFLLVQLNFVLRRLAAMLPDENLRGETKLFTTFNITLLAAALLGIGGYLALQRMTLLPEFLVKWTNPNHEPPMWMTWVALFLVLMPLAMTMALIWKVKEVIFASIIDAER